MIFTPTRLAPAHLIDLEKFSDERGFFARALCAKELSAAGLNTEWAQVNLSHTRHKGTIRGFHYQIAPWREIKLVRCVRGRIYDVVIDIRLDSPSYGQWMGVELDGDEHRAFYVPEGFAHSFQSLTDDVVLTYDVSKSYTPGAERGIRYNDPAFGVVWPLEVTLVSEKDRMWPDFVLGRDSA
jgi:dTDP-4-dehydrorhamnose 3,5-epimerase